MSIQTALINHSISGDETMQSWYTMAYNKRSATLLAQQVYRCSANKGL